MFCSSILKPAFSVKDKIAVSRLARRPFHLFRFNLYHGGSHRRSSQGTYLFRLPRGSIRYMLIETLFSRLLYALHIPQSLSSEKLSDVPVRLHRRGRLGSDQQFSFVSNLGQPCRKMRTPCARMLLERFHVGLRIS